MNDVKQLFEQHEKDDTRRFGEINTKLDTVLNNHLAHMEPDISAIKEGMKRQDWLLMGIVSGIGTIIVGVLISILTKTL